MTASVGHSFCWALGQMRAGRHVTRASGALSRGSLALEDSAGRPVFMFFDAASGQSGAVDLSASDCCATDWRTA